ncbi:hypothetical protein, partial [Bacillus sp. SIMBA_005]|uniref:hypothetical protein n=1 Tax=Bacillus sp. SIMBA_005 TaxID=3085754 RepID=UPI00397B1D09
ATGRADRVSWDGLQRAVLDALGHTRYTVQSGAPDAPPLPDDPLLDALLQAAGRDRAADDAGAVYRSVGSLAALRQAPAKRALWPTL